jgi:hypothetical protein
MGTFERRREMLRQAGQRMSPLSAMSRRLTGLGVSDPSYEGGDYSGMGTGLLTGSQMTPATATPTPTYMEGLWDNLDPSRQRQQERPRWAPNTLRRY